FDFLIRQRSEQRETPRANPERPPVANLHRQRFYRIISTDAVGADGFVTASDDEERRVAGGFGELHENGPGEATKLKALRGGPAEENNFGAQPECLRLARHLDESLLAQRREDARSGGFAQPHGAGDVGEA